MRDIALAAGVTASLARLYPVILDAVFVVACAAALTLRDARWWTRGYAWLSVLVTGALIGAADAYHAMGLRLPHKVAAGTVAALPVALVLLGFSLWLSMLRHTRWSRTAAATGPRVPAELGAGPALAIETGQPAPAEAVSAAARPGLPALFASLWPATENTRPETEGVPPAESTPPGTEGAPPAQGALPAEDSSPAMKSARPDEGAPSDADSAPLAEDFPASTESAPSDAESTPLAEDFPASPESAPAAESAPLAEDSPASTEGAPPAVPDPAPEPASGRAAETTPEPAAGPAAAHQPAPARLPAERPAEALTPPYGFPSAAPLDPAFADEAPAPRTPSAHVSVRPGPRDR